MESIEQSAVEQGFFAEAGGAGARANAGRKWQLDFLKGISCIIVVLLHVRLPGIIGDLIIYAMRFPVPLFFMISGYFACGKPLSYYRRVSLKLLKLIVKAEFLYACLYLASSLLHSDYPALSTTFSQVIRKLLCGSFFNGVLWYLYAAFWTCALMALFYKLKVLDKLLPLALLLILVQCYGRFYVQNRCDIDKYIFLFRNALSFGFPMTMAGYYIAKYEGAIREKIKLPQSFAVIFAGGVLIAAEYFGSGQYMDFHLSTLFVSVGMFLFALNYGKPANGAEKLTAFIGRELSLNIYVYHMMASQIIVELYNAAPFCGNYAFQWLKPLLTCALSIAWAWVLFAVNKKNTSKSQTIVEKRQ